MQNNYSLTSDRTAHITATDDATIISAGLEARTELMGGRVAESDKIRDYLNGERIVPHNAGVIGQRLAGAGPTGPLMFPVRRKASNRANSVRRSFRFTIEGRPGRYKLEPIHQAPEGMDVNRAVQCGYPCPVVGQRIVLVSHE